MELALKYRPKTLEQVRGQAAACKVLNGWIRKGAVPHTILFTGPAGTGKTSLGRILRTELKCNIHDFKELNTADLRGVDTIRTILQRMTMAPIGKSRVWMIDECHQLTKDAQEAFLKAAEEPPDHVYFILCTTDPQKLSVTLRQRCQLVALKPVTHGDLVKLVGWVATQEEKEIPEEVVEKIATLADGSPRRALKCLDQIIDLDTEEEMLGAIAKQDLERHAWEIGRILMDPRSQWANVVKLLKDPSVEKEVQADPEGIRYMLLAWAGNTVLGKKGQPATGQRLQRAMAVLACFAANWYDCKSAGLLLSCYQVIHSK